MSGADNPGEQVVRVYNAAKQETCERSPVNTSPGREVERLIEAVKGNRNEAR